MVFHVREVGRAVRFYVETLGMKLVREAPDGAAIIDAGEGFCLELRAGEPQTSGQAVTLHPKVPLADAVEILENRGVAFSFDEASGGRRARFHDLDGNPLALSDDAVAP